MNKELFIRAISRFAAGLLLVSGLLFIPAGTWDYPQGWLLIGILFVPMFIAGLVMMKKNPELLSTFTSISPSARPCGLRTESASKSMSGWL